ncbi:exosortase F system-associated membrane protein [Moheibacter lacus]|uniref:Exosortase F system-associated protein n=1 Tax=Moheibacter lacus TaxID=2745851 RepID=A0A838ZLM3_9FLAO|nr:exosortase F system-associated protein [Moheibacter lacus]MBA5629384.1 exosortase F system-associated protein [Moheibacter lacus]
MNKWLRYFLAAVLIFGLILVRKYETELFYDPFLLYFKTDFYSGKFPDYDLGKLILNHLFRYFLNLLLSVWIVGLIFWRKDYVKYTILIGVGFLIIFLPLYLFFLETQFSLGVNYGFYVRRFLIQPVLLLLLIPAFFYHQQKTKEI